jgi:hypothetical protein
VSGSAPQQPSLWDAPTPEEQARTAKLRAALAATFTLSDGGQGGTDLTLTDTGVPAQDRAEVTTGWVSVLLALKAAADFGADLRNHDPARSWEQGYVEN